MKYSIAPERAREILEGVSRLRLLVVGDLMLDHWVWGSVSRISPEAPIPVVDVERYTYTPGGAANVVSNLRALGAQVSLLGVVGADDAGRRLKVLLKRQGVEVDGLITDRWRPTSLKTRIVAHNQQVVRADYERKDPLVPELLEQVNAWCAEHGPKFSAVLLSDYHKGLFQPRSTSALIEALGGQVPVIAGPKPANLDLFRLANLVTLNASEAAAASGLPTQGESAVRAAGEALLSRLERSDLLITRGEHGMSLFERSGAITSVPALATQVFDVSGAGDTVLATVGLSLAAGATPREAISLASHAAAVVVRKVGTATATAPEILGALAPGPRPARKRRSR